MDLGHMNTSPSQKNSDGNFKRVVEKSMYLGFRELLKSACTWASESC
jgi:hypothetical protein